MTLRVRERLRRYLAGVFQTVQEDPTLRDGAQNTKPKVALAVGGAVPAAVGDTGVPRTAVPTTTAVDAIGA